MDSNNWLKKEIWKKNNSELSNKSESPEEERNEPEPVESHSNQIEIEKILAGIEKRTTVVLKNISKRNKIPDVVYLLRQKGVGNYDIIYIPLKKKSKKNFGFAFINFTEPKYIINFYKSFHLQYNEQIGKYFKTFFCHIQGFQKIRDHFDAKYLYVVTN